MLISFFKDGNLQEELSDKDIPELSTLLNGEGINLFLRVNYECKNLGLYIIESTSTSDFRYPQELSLQSSKINILQIGSKGTGGLKVINLFDNNEKVFSLEEGSDFDNRILVTTQDQVIEVNTILKINLSFESDETISGGKRLFFAIESGAESIIMP